MDDVLYSILSQVLLTDPTHCLLWVAMYSSWTPWKMRGRCSDNVVYSKLG